MAKRKTILVHDLKDRVNRQIAAADSEFNNKSTRMALFAMMEEVLMDTGNYRGFMYQSPLNDPNHDDTRVMFI